MNDHFTTHFTTAPIHALLEVQARERHESMQDAARRTGLPERTLFRVLAADFLDWRVADRVAVALGHHPCQLWPEWFGSTG
jgi:lambda repressor-like predicted transcriptional regulator